MKKTKDKSDIWDVVIFFVMQFMLASYLTSCAPPARAGSTEWFTWDDTNTALHVPLTVLYAVDLGQTLWIADNCNPVEHKQWRDGVPEYWSERECHEHYNIYLDEHPSKGEVYTYFAASYIVTTAIVYALPEKYSHAFQGGVISLEAYMVNNNYHFGIGVKF